MNQKSHRTTLLSLVSLALIATTALASGGGGVPQGAATMRDSAAGAYERGLKYRDKAWELTEGLESATGGTRAKLQKKINKEYEKAIRAYRTAIRTNPKMHQAHSSLGYALRKTARYEEALDAYNLALEIKPSYAEAIEYRAEAYLGLDRIDEAKEAYMTLFRADREKADELMIAMARWVTERTESPKVASLAQIEEFAGWVRERGGLAKQTARLGGAAGSAWD